AYTHNLSLSFNRLQTSLILFVVTRKIPALYIVDILRNGFGHILVKVHITTEKTRIKFVGHAQSIVEYQHLSISTISGTDTNNRYRDTFGYFSSQISRNFFKYNGKTSHFF